MTDDKQKDQQPGFGSIVMSTLAAAYVVSGIIFVILFITSIVTLVKYLIAHAGP